MRASTKSSLLFLWFLLVAIIIARCSVACNQIERDALLVFKHGLKDPSNRLSSWTDIDDDDSDCCKWYGVICDYFTDHVTELHLGLPSKKQYYSASSNGDTDYEEYRERFSFGGKINQSLLNLKHLKHLDLSNNDFGGIQIPDFLGSMGSLRYLNLSMARFGGRIPHQLGNLTNLLYLNLNREVEYFVPDIYVIKSLNWLSSIRSLQFLDLSRVNLNSVFDWLDVLNSLPSLVELHLSGCMLSQVNPPLRFNVNFSSLVILDFSYVNFGKPDTVVPTWIFRIETLIDLDLSWNSFVGPIPIHLLNLTSLRKLDLSGNRFNSSIPNWLQYGFSNLQLLHLSYNFLEGRIPNSIGNLTSLNSLDLSYNFLEGGFPKSFENLCNLRLLNVSNNKLSQEMNEMSEIFSICVSNSLEWLVLSYNQLSGHLTDRLSQLKNLAGLLLNDNLIVGPIPESLGELNSLKTLDIGNNRLNGTLPLGFGMLENLKIGDFYGNSLEGDVSEIHFANLKNLERFDASGNHLNFRVSSDWIPPFKNLTLISLKDWHVGPSFPAWIRSLKHLEHVDFSNTKISSTLPIWFLNLTFKTFDFDFSQNQMHGKIPNINLTSIDSAISCIDLSSNQFQGPLPIISSNLQLLDLSNNSFSGSLSEFLCDKMHEVKDLKILNLGENLLSGQIPDCLKIWENLAVLRLSNNNFDTNIPASMGALSRPEFLDLHSNNLSGEVPMSLQDCNKLSVLDLSENKFEGDVSTWTEQLYQLVILNLRGNKLHGRISNRLCQFKSLQILDLASNDINGTIPKCISNLTAMVEIQDGNSWTTGWFFESVQFFVSSSIVRKGKVVEYRNNLYLVKGFDLSDNKLSGEIPEEITSLKALQSLNLSYNFLIGRIPGGIGSMQSLESLDFSQNQLVGEIPGSLSSLTFLSNLNLSNNKLSGKIPESTQLQSFISTSYIGNSLCGPPLLKNCSAGNPPDNKNEGNTEGDESATLDWFYFYVSIAPGFVVGFWCVMGPLVFNRRWRHLYFQFLDSLWIKIVVRLHVHAC